MKRIFVITTRCNSEAERFGTLPQNLDRKIKKLESGEGDIDEFRNFPGNYFKIQTTSGNADFRIVGTYKDETINDEAVRCCILLRVFRRSDNDYDSDRGFIKRNTSETRRAEITGLNQIDWNKITQEVQERLAIPPKPVVPKESLSIEEESFLTDTKITHEIFDAPIYESIDWIQSVHKKDFGDYFKAAKALEEHIILGESEGLTEISYGERGDKILAYRFPNKDSFFLLGLGNDETLQQLRKCWEERLQENGIDLTTPEGEAAIIRTCRRAYPLSMLDDKDFWRDMENDARSNFYLSDEEMKIVSENLSFPLFINGRAGSGKSTVLQYLFAEYLLRYLAYPSVAPPLYLSYSKNLIEGAKLLAKSLFDKNNAYLTKLKEIDKELTDAEPYFKDSFSIFQELIRRFISEKNREVLSQRFTFGEKYIDYAKFRKIWFAKFGKERAACKNYGPAISWHIIRSYIKGWNYDEFLEPEEYENIGRSNQSVTQETFENVFQKVWTEWYQPLCEEYGFWDDQDLVRYCIAPADGSAETCIEPRFSAVFCDESQDFTRAETEFILRCSVFSQRKIYDEAKIAKLPFVFAGDEFQTLNPTGFSWDTLRAYFTERLIRVTEVKTSHGTPDPITLTKNYRSTEPIVKLGNRLQLLRQARFGGGETDIVPQSPNFSDQHAEPVYCLSPNDSQVWEKLKEVQAVLIVPCEDGQTVKDYIENSPIKDHIEFYPDGSSVGITIYNPAQAKGLEYGVVAVYGFGNNEQLLPSKLKKFFTDGGANTDDAEIEQKYFLNNAYVSVTRAQRQLFIIDEMADGRKTFWSFAFSDSRTQKDVDEIESQMLLRIRNREKWSSADNKSVLGLIVRGGVDNLTGQSLLIGDPNEIAKKTEEQGLSLRDPELTRSAAARYRERGKNSDALRCEAFADRFDENYLSAGSKFKEGKLFDEAVKCFWLACGSTDEQKKPEALAELAKLKQKQDSLEVRTATQLQKKQPEIKECLIILNSLVDILFGQNVDNRSRIYEEASQWIEVLDTLLPRVEIKPLTSMMRERVQKILGLCETLKNDLPIDLEFQAEWFYQLGNTAKAIELWDKLFIQGKSTRNENYYKAKVATVAYPANLEFRTHINDWERSVAEEYHNSPETVLSDKHLLIVAKAILKYGSKEEIKKVLPDLLLNETNLHNVLDSLSAAAHKDDMLPKDYLEAFLRCKLRGPIPKKILEELKTTAQTRELAEMIEALNYVRSPQFEMDLQNTRPKESEVDVTKIYGVEATNVRKLLNEKFRLLMKTVWNQPLLMEVGGVFEKRREFRNMLMFYEWADSQTDDAVFKKELALRWIACKERQAEYDNSEEHWQKAMNRRKEVRNYDELPLEPVFTHWRPLLEKIMLFSATQNKKPQAVLKEETLPPKTDEPKVLPSIPEIDTDSQELVKSGNQDKWFDIPLFGYSFRFNPAKFELTIAVKTEDEDLWVKIKGGHFPKDSDFRLEDGQLKKESGEATPFSMNLSHSIVVVVHNESGVQLMFPNPSPNARQKTIIKNTVKEMFAKPH